MRMEEDVVGGDGMIVLNCAIVDVMGFVLSVSVSFVCMSMGGW